MRGRLGWAAGITAVTLVALAFRMAGLKGRGVVGHDEATFLLEAKYILDRGGEDRPGTAHPAHTALLVLASRFFGWSDVIGPGVSAVCGAASVPVLASIGRMTGGTAVGGLAAMALAISPFHVRYSRSGGSDVPATFWLCVAVWAACRLWRTGGGVRWAGVAGLPAGLSSLSHYRYIGPVAVLGAGLLWAGARRERRRAAGLAWGMAYAGGGLLAWLGMEGWYAWLRATGRGPETYLHQLVWRLFEYGGRLTLEDPLAQVRALWILDGPAAVGLAAAGLAGFGLAAFRRKPADLVAYLWGVGPLVIWSVYSAGGIFPRCLVMGLPGLALLTGWGGNWLAGAAGVGRQWALAAVVLVILASGVPRAVAETRVRGGYRGAAMAVAEDVVRRGVPARLHWVHGPVWRLYMLEAARKVGRTPEALLEVVNTSAPPTFWNYAIVDPYVYALEPESREQLDRLMAKAEPLGAWPNTWANDRVLLQEMSVGPARLAQLGGVRDLSRLKVYRWPG